MKKKWVIRSVVGLFGILILAVVVLAFSLGAIVKKGVEQVGPTATKVDVKLKSAQVWLVGARIQLQGFVLGNPPGCKTPHSISVDDVSVSVKPGSAFSDKLVVNTIHVKSAVITFEGGLMDNNIKKIEKNLNDFIGGTPQATNSASSSTEAKAGKKLQVNDLLISGAKVQINTTLSGGKTITLPIPDIHLTNLGTGADGITPVEVSEKALNAMLIAATKEIAKNASQLGKDVLNGGTGAAKNATDRLKGLFH